MTNSPSDKSSIDALAADDLMFVSDTSAAGAIKSYTPTQMSTFVMAANTDIVLTTQSNTYDDGFKQIFNPSATTAGVNTGAHTADASSPVNGDIIYNSTSETFRGYQNGSWQDLIGAGSVSELNDIGDVTITTVATGEIIKWSGSAWINNTLVEAGIQEILSGAALSTATVAGTDKVLIQDTDDSDNLKTVTAQAIADLGAGGTPTDITVANEATDTTCFPSFFTAATGDLGPKTNTNLTYNSNTGAFGITGALTVDNLTVNGNTITADTGALNLTPASGSAIVLDGAINVDAGVVTGATSITSTAFVGALTGNADTVTTNANLTGPITSVGNATSIAAQTGTGTTFVVNTSPTLVTPNIGAATMGGDLACAGNNITDVHELQIDALPDTDHTANGLTTNSISAGVTTAVGELLYLATDGEWALADADAEATASGMMAVSLAVGSDGNPLLVALAGSFVRDDTFAFTIGEVLYASATAGVITATAPSGTGDIVRVIGYAVTADIVYFNPSGTWVEVA